MRILRMQVFRELFRKKYRIFCSRYTILTINQYVTIINFFILLTLVLQIFGINTCFAWVILRVSEKNGGRKHTVEKLVNNGSIVNSPWSIANILWSMDY